jgi:hypothetical protein
MIKGKVIAAGMVALAALGLSPAASPTAASAADESRTTVIMYDNFEKPGGYTMADYFKKWQNKFGPGEMAVKETRSFKDGVFSVGAVPYQTAHDSSVLDHVKYFGTSSETFKIPRVGSIEFSADFTAETPGIQPGHVIHGTYGPPYSYPAGKPWQQTLMDGQQAAVSLHMIDFHTGQLFDWLVTSTLAYPLTERLPSSVANPALLPGDPSYAGRKEMYTQYLNPVPISPGPHNYAIRFTRTQTTSWVEYFLDGRLVTKVDKTGIPVDVQGVPYTGTFPSLGPGKLLVEEINSVTMAHGLVGVVDAFPFHHHESPEMSVSIPRQERLFGQGARSAFDNFQITTVDGAPSMTQSERQ